MVDDNDTVDYIAKGLNMMRHKMMRYKMRRKKWSKLISEFFLFIPDNLK